MGQQFFAGAIDKLQAVLPVERKHSHVDFSHDGAQQRRRFHRAETLFAQRLAQVVDFEHYLAERVARKRAPPANGKVAFTNRCEDVGECLQRPDDALFEIERDAQPQQHEEQIDGPLHLRGVAAVPQQEGTQRYAGKTSRKREQRDAPFKLESVYHVRAPGSREENDVLF